MKQHYAFSKAEVGKYYRPLASLELPVYLDRSLKEDLFKLSQQSGKDINVLVNDLLKKDLELIHTGSDPILQKS
jgi:hypothetical protein